VKLQLADRLAELPYRIRPLARAGIRTWPLTAEELGRISLVWPERYQWPTGGRILETLRDGLVLLRITEVRRTPQVHEGVHTLGCIVDGREYTLVLDYSDNHHFINDAALADADLYIKLQYRRTGYSDPRIIPGGYVTTGRDFYSYYIPFRDRYAHDRRIDVAGRFGYTFQEEVRRKAVRLLSDAKDIRFVGSTGKVRYSRFLREAAAARLSLHMPGNGPFTHRVAEFLGIGTCMLSVRFATELHVPLEPGVHYVEIAADLGDLVEKCRYYLHHADERERIARAGREYFDRFLHFDQLASYYVRTILDHLGTSPNTSRPDS
jgi:hypothetical protein